jgi:hypothetical protein
MTHPEVPQQPSLLARNAFDEAARKIRQDRRSKFNVEKRQREVGLCIGGAAGYFASHRDDRLSQIGSRALRALVQQEVGIVIPNLNDNEVVALAERARPYVVPVPTAGEGDRSALFVPLNFVEVARQNPIEALLLILPAFCVINVIVDGRFKDNPNGVTPEIREMLETFYGYAQQESAQFSSPIVEEMIETYRNAPTIAEEGRRLTLEEFLRGLTI